MIHYDSLVFVEKTHRRAQHVFGRAVHDAAIRWASLREIARLQASHSQNVPGVIELIIRNDGVAMKSESLFCVYRLLDTKYLAALDCFKSKIPSSALGDIFEVVSKKPFNRPDIGELFAFMPYAKVAFLNDSMLQSRWRMGTRIATSMARCTTPVTTRI